MCLQATIYFHLTMCLADTRLITTENYKNYAVEGFYKIFRNKQTWESRERPPHGLIAYVKDAQNVLEQHSH